jgi:hypothetical protein
MLSGSFALISYFVIPMWFVSLAATAVCAYTYATRQTAQTNHQHSLKTLAQAYEWALNSEEAETNKTDPLIQEMCNVILPLLTEDEIKWITKNQIENAAVNEAKEDKNNITIHGYHMNDGIYQKMYGANQEGFTAFAKAVLASVLVGFYRFGALAYNTVSSFTSNNKTNSSPSI